MEKMNLFSLSLHSLNIAQQLHALNSIFFLLLLSTY